MPRKPPATAAEEPTAKTRKSPPAKGKPGPAPAPPSPRKRPASVSPPAKPAKPASTRAPKSSPAPAPAPPPAPPPRPDPDAGLTPADLETLALLEDPEFTSLMERRARVARLRSRKLSMREIGLALGISAATVYRDLRAIDEDWRREAAEDLANIRARELAELRDMEYQAATALSGAPTEDAKIRWMAERRQLKARIASLLGLDAPRTFTGEIEVKDGGLSTLERRALAAEILAGHAAAGEEGADGDQ